MKIYAICLVRNELDIIDRTIEHALGWADKLLIVDNASDDGTWERIQERKGNRLIPVTRTEDLYSDALRGRGFNAFRSELEEGDWWAIQDADEFFYDDPRSFLPRIEHKYHVVASKKVDRRIPKEWTEGPDALQEAPPPTPQGIPYFTSYAWSELRFFRHRPRLKWPEGAIWPKRIGIVAPERIRVEHYPLRSLEQVRKKYEEKIAVHHQDPRFFRHIASAEDWKDMLPDKQELLYDDGEQDIFQRVSTRNDLNTRSYKYLIKRIFHSLGIWP
ncbi:MAG: glycosyltransferase family 2 protein [Flavobacteriales bacterium]